jgi:hypothetical protein
MIFFSDLENEIYNDLLKKGIRFCYGLVEPKRSLYTELEF